MGVRTAANQPRFRAYGRRHIDLLPEISRLSVEQRVALKAVSSVLAFRVNDYVLGELIDWDDIPNDPIFQTTFPQAGMLERDDLLRLEDMVVRGEEGAPLEQLVSKIRLRMNPNPAGQKLLNVPRVDGEEVFVLKMVQGRDPGWVSRPFIARFDSQATWLDDLRPAFGVDQFFFDPYIRAMYEGRWQPERARSDDDCEERSA